MPPSKLTGTVSSSSKRPANATPNATPNAPSASSASSTPAPSDALLTKLQAYVYQEIHRSQITNAPYNPRVISDYTRKRLRKQLETHGLVEALVWNLRTGHLVGGHQRLSIIDAVEGTQDYRIGVAAIDVDLKQEMEINVALNNPHTQGSYDADKFFAMLKLPEAPSVEAMGFTTADLEMEFGAIPEVHDAFVEAEQHLAQTEQDLQALKERRKEGKKRLEDDPENDADYYVMIIFRNAKDKEGFFDHLNRPYDARFIQADELFEYLKEQYQWKRP